MEPPDCLERAWAMRSERVRRTYLGLCDLVAAMMLCRLPCALPAPEFMELFAALFADSHADDWTTAHRLVLADPAEGLTPQNVRWVHPRSGQSLSG